MSMYFELGDETLWNPSNGAGRLFMRQVEAFEAELGLPSGIGQGKHGGDPDTLAVDPVAYAEFVRGLVAWHCGTSHSVILARRAGIDVEMPASETGRVWGGVRRDVQVPGNARVSSAVVVDALDTRAREVDRWMAR